jgi:hypothetical protein
MQKKYNLSLHSKFLVDVKYKGGQEFGLGFNQRRRFYDPPIQKSNVNNEGVCVVTLWALPFTLLKSIFGKTRIMQTQKYFTMQKI